MLKANSSKRYDILKTIISILSIKREVETLHQETYPWKRITDDSREFPGNKMKFDDILETLGEFGPSQRRLYILLSLPAIQNAVIGMVIFVFLFAVPEHR